MKRKEFYQFKFSDSFKCFETEKVIDYYKSYDELPDYMKEFISNELDKTVIKDYNINKFYCPICLNELNDLYCDNCNKSFESKKIHRTDINSLRRINEYYNLRYYDYCCIFDFKDDKPLLYCFTTKVHYRNDDSIYIHRIIKTELEYVYSIETDRIVELKSNNVYLYDDIDDFLSVDSIKEQFMNYFDVDMLDHKLNKVDRELLSRIYYSLFCDYKLYKDNLDELKNYDLFKYSYLWKLKDSGSNVKIASLSYYPLHIKSFEFLMKLGLYNLAIDCPFEVNKGKTFIERFGVDKNYLESMKQLDIDYDGLKVFRMYPTNYKKLFNFILEHIYLYSEIKDFVDAKKVYKYIKENDIDFYNYYDYIFELNRQGYNMNDNSLIYPKNFCEKHDKLFVESLILKDKNINDKINSLSKIYSMNIYEDDKYIIFPASSVESLIDESKGMSNCVKNYCERISEKESQIFFMRSKKNRNKSLITIEVYNGKVVQALGRFNKKITDDELKIVNKFEKNLINIKVI